MNLQELLNKSHRVILESPYAPKDGVTTEEHVEYAKRCLLDSLNRGEAPFASHLLYTLSLDDTDPKQRDQGLEAASKYYDPQCVSAVFVYTDYGLSKGMERGISYASEMKIPVYFRSIGRNQPDASRMDALSA